MADGLDLTLSSITGPPLAVSIDGEESLAISGSVSSLGDVSLSVGARKKVWQPGQPVYGNIARVRSAGTLSVGEYIASAEGKVCM